MTEYSESSISSSISKLDAEERSMFRASMDDAADRLKKGIKPESISSERIEKGNTLLDTYEVVSDAVHGGMGSVWCVHHKNWDTDLAMKRPQPKYFAEGSSERKEEFVRECENWIELGLHPNIVSCYYVRDISGVPSIFSEWMDNGSLKDRIADGCLYEGSGEEVQKRMLDIAIQSARGLQYSHENGLIHQDIKPGNILLTKEWDAKVADFGLAKAGAQLTEGSDAGKTSGYTPAYCPKEQAEGAEPAEWMDWYAWALTVLSMYAGQGHTGDDRLWKTGAEAKDRFDEYPAQCEWEIPGGIAGLLKACLLSCLDEGIRFGDIEDTLLQVYRALFGEDYPVERPAAAGDTADSLNNRALSYLDLGKKEDALALWDQALKVRPNHFYTSYNLLTVNWYDGKIDDLSGLIRLKEIDRFMNHADSAEGLKHFRECRGTDELIREDIPDFDIPAVPAGHVFEYTDAENGTRLAGVSPEGRGYGNLKLYDLKTGRCIRTICPRLSEDPEISGGAESDLFSEAWITGDGLYCYPNRLHTKVYYRRPDMRSLSPVWMLSRIQPYSEIADKKRKLDKLVLKARVEIEDFRIPEAYELIGQAYELVESTENDSLNRLNEKICYYGRISGIRNYSVSSYSEPLSLENRQALRNGEGYPIEYKRKDDGAEITLDKKFTVSLPHSGICFSEQYLQNRNKLYFLQTIEGRQDERRLCIVNTESKKLIPCKLLVRGNMLRISPDETKLITVEYIENKDRPVTRLLHVYSVEEEKEVRTIRIPDNAFDISGEPRSLYEMQITDICFRHDSEAVFVMKGSGALTMIDLQSEQEIVLHGDDLTIDRGNSELLQDRVIAIAADKDSVCCMRESRSCYNWRLTYGLEFKGWTDWDRQADTLLEKYAEKNPVYSEKQLDDFLEVLRKNGFANIREEAVAKALQEQCEKAQKKEAAKSRRPFFLHLGIIAALAVLAVFSVVSYRSMARQALKMQEIWRTGETVQAEVTVKENFTTWNPVSLKYTVDGKDYEDSCIVQFANNTDRGDVIGSYENGKGTIELHYLAEDPSQYAVIPRYAAVSTLSFVFRIIYLCSFLYCICMTPYIILKQLRARKDRSRQKKTSVHNDDYYIQKYGRKKL
ncbi:MAG: protein kinase [Solobacterium sp.]|nr:protein kinase [Solobacterium sp.]